MRVNTMEDDSVFEEEGEERDSFVQPARGLRSFALVSWLFIRTLVTSSWNLLLHDYAVLRIRVPDPNFSIPDPHKII
jgi:hypothetical protein